MPGQSSRRHRAEWRQRFFGSQSTSAPDEAPPPQPQPVPPRLVPRGTVVVSLAASRTRRARALAVVLQQSGFTEGQDSERLMRALRTSGSRGELLAQALSLALVVSSLQVITDAESSVVQVPTAHCHGVARASSSAASGGGTGSTTGPSSATPPVASGGDARVRGRPESSSVADPRFDGDFELVDAPGSASATLRCL